MNAIETEMHFLYINMP